MSALTNWFGFCNYAGDAAFCAGGTLAAVRERKSPIIALLSAIFTTFGGGAILRDMLTLGAVPKILGSPGEIAAVAVFAALLMLVFTNDRPFRAIRKRPTLAAALKKTLVVADSLGVLAFVKIGYERGIEFDGSIVIAVICGFYTACGGGILALVARGLAEKGAEKKGAYIKSKLVKNAPYYIYGFLMSLTYCVLAIANADSNVAVLTALAVGLGFLTDKEITGRG